MAGSAIHTIGARAAAARPAADARLRALDVDADELTELVRSRARPTLNFHADRLDRAGRTVASGLLADGRYRTQYETGISGGGRSAVVGGHRPRWEVDLFGEVVVTSPPIYGALDLTRDPHGGSPRFGSSFVVLHRHCLERATFSAGDSHVGPADVGTLDVLAPVLAGTLERSGPTDPSEFITLIERGSDVPARSLDDYVEMQIHGGVDLRADVASIHLDPSFRDTHVGATMAHCADRHGFELHWHGGSELRADDVPADFRGPSMPELARRTARPDGIVDAHAIGIALAEVPYTPPGPSGDPEDSPLQRYKQLWHCLLRFGSDARPTIGRQAAD